MIRIPVWLKGKKREKKAVAPLHHPSHPHPLLPEYLGDTSYLSRCDLCRCPISEHGYYCTLCKFYAHKLCAESPPLIRNHPFHPLHPLSLSHDRPSFTCNACDRTLDRCSSLGCDVCGFVLDLRCALFTLPSGPGSSPPLEEGGQISIPVHDHPLTSFLASWEFCCDCDCALCHDDLQGDAYVCLHPRCKFLIHKRCIQDLFYKDGSRVPRVYHWHEIAIFSVEEGKSIRCGNCESNISGESLGCQWCSVFYHRDCIQAPEILQYPLHPDHVLVLFIRPGRNKTQCQSCSFFVVDDLCYRCTGCDFALHVRCGLRTLLYCEEGRTLEIEPSWHEHPLLLCNRANIHLDRCSCCGDSFDGPAYRCKEKDCGLVLHQGCTKQSSRIDHPHHPEHPLVLLPKFEEPRPICNACCRETVALSFSCELCRFYLHIGCASRFPTLKHYLHEHDLIRFERIPSLECNRCGTSTDSPLLRCVPCDFNLHEKCTELPGVVKHKTHHHPLTLRDFFMEDDTGEYYCDLCEQRRDGRLGVYMCLACKMDRPWTFHIECILPELRKVNVKKERNSVLKESAEDVAKKEERLRTLEKKVEETKRELEELRKRHAQLSLLSSQGGEED